MRNYILKSLLIILFITCIPARAEENSIPHVEAINLVVKTQFKDIRKIDKDNWWHDTKLREWSVRRLVYPGTIDSRHMFVVTYSIEGKLVLSWSVNTKENTVSIMESTH